MRPRPQKSSCIPRLRHASNQNPPTSRPPSRTPPSKASSSKSVLVFGWPKTPASLAGQPFGLVVTSGGTWSFLTTQASKSFRNHQLGQQQLAPQMLPMGVLDGRVGHWQTTNAHVGHPVGIMVAALSKTTGPVIVVGAVVCGLVTIVPAFGSAEMDGHRPTAGPPSMRGRPASVSCGNRVGVGGD